jgi:hypothetical protein
VKYGVGAVRKMASPSALSTTTEPGPGTAVGPVSKNTRSPESVSPSVLPNTCAIRFCTDTST